MKIKMIENNKIRVNSNDYINIDCEYLDIGDGIEEGEPQQWREIKGESTGTVAEEYSEVYIDGYLEPLVQPFPHRPSRPLSPPPGLSPLHKNKYSHKENEQHKTAANIFSSSTHSQEQQPLINNPISKDGDKKTQPKYNLVMCGLAALTFLLISICVLGILLLLWHYGIIWPPNESQYIYSIIIY
jgi:hypothetical protein